MAYSLNFTPDGASHHMKFCLDGGRGGNFYQHVLARGMPFVSSTTLATAPELVYRREPQIGKLRNQPASKEEMNESLTALASAVGNATIAAIHREEELNAYALKQQFQCLTHGPSCS